MIEGRDISGTQPAPSRPGPKAATPPPGEFMAVEPSFSLKRGRPLVPSTTIAGRALVTVVAILTFLAALTASAAQLVADASRDWRSDVGREITIQVRPQTGIDVDVQVERAASIARAAPGVDRVSIFSKAASERLLEPWLGAGLDLVELPIPRLVVVTLTDGARPDLDALRKALTDQVTGASLDDHRLWIERLATMANTVVIIGLVIVVLVLTAAALAIGFATRGALAGAKDIVEVLHFVGADDRFIARQFQDRFLQLGLKGGLIGGAAAAFFLALAGFIVGSIKASPGGNQIEALFGTFDIGTSGYLTIAAVVFLVAAVTALVSRETVRHQLKAMS